MDRDRFEKQAAFILEADKEKNILRQTHLTGHGRRENDAEHAWHMAMMIWLMREYANEEIDAGDTYAYDEEGAKTQKEREEKAADRIFGLLPEDQAAELRALFEEFEARSTPEARFARTMDNFQPILLNHSNGGSDWREHGVCLSQVLGRHKRNGEGSQVIGDYILGLIEENVRRGNIEDR